MCVCERGLCECLPLQDAIASRRSTTCHCIFADLKGGNAVVSAVSQAGSSRLVCITHVMSPRIVVRGMLSPVWSGCGGWAGVVKHKLC